MLPPRPWGDHAARCGAADEEVLLQVQRLVLVPGLLVDVEQRSPARHPHDVDQDVQVAQGVRGPVDDLLGLGLVGHIARDRLAAAPDIPDLSGHGLRALRQEVDHTHVTASPRQQVCGRAPHSLSSAHDQCVLAVESEQ